MDRVQVLLSPEEEEAFRRVAEREGMSLSAWLRQAGLARLESWSQRQRIRTVEALGLFFADCDEREQGPEPDWNDHLETMRRSRSRGDSGT